MLTRPVSWITMVISAAPVSFRCYYKPLVEICLTPFLMFQEPATVTVTETVCGPGPSEAPGDSPIISIPETTLVTDTPAPSPAPTFDQPPALSETGSASPSVEPTSTEAPTSSPEGHTTTFQSSPSSSADESEAPTATFEAPSSTVAPIVNAGYTEGGMSTIVLALTLTFLRLLGF